MMLLALLSIYGSLHSQEYFLFTGTYTSGNSKGIYVYDYNSGTGAVTLISIAEGIENPSYLAIAPDKRHLYAVVENGGDKPGELASFSFDPSSGKLSFINKQATAGDDPCYISVDASGKFAVTANYSGGSFTVFPIGPDGSLSERTELIIHKGKSLNKSRQEKPHVHSVVFSPDQHYLLVSDLGTDKVTSYSFDPDKEKPVSEKPYSFVNTIAGNGPRHLCFHPSKPFAYLSEEMSGTVSVFGYADGKLNRLQTISSHPKDYKGKIGSADIHISPDGKFLYASNRGDANSIAIYSIESTTGLLRLIGFQPVMGKTPRNFAIDPAGNFLLVANKDSDNVVIFKRNKKTGLLQYTGKQIKVPNPVCLKFLQK